MGTVTLWIAGGMFVALIGLWRWLSRRMERQMQRDMDRFVFPHFHENRALRRRLDELEGEPGVSEGS